MKERFQTTREYESKFYKKNYDPADIRHLE